MSQKLEVIRLESSALEACCYDGRRRILAILMRNGRAYNYLAVPSNVADGLKRAASAGKFFNKEIAGIYESVTIDGDTFRNQSNEVTQTDPMLHAYSIVHRNG